MLRLLDAVLISQAMDESLRQELTAERATVAEHLSLARALAASLSPERLTDGQIAFVQKTLNASEVAQANLALSKAARADVRAFAQRMVEDHTAANLRLEAIEKAASIPDLESPLRKQLEAQNARTLANLQTIAVPAFDLAYAQSQVAGHALALQLLDEVLIPEARDVSLTTIPGGRRRLHQTSPAPARSTPTAHWSNQTTGRAPSDRLLEAPNSRGPTPAR